MTGADGRPIIGPDGKPVTVEAKVFNTELPPNQKEARKDLENGKYKDDAFFGNNYKLVDPTSEPTRKQDCGGNAVEQLWGIPNVVVHAEEFNKKIIIGTKAEEVVVVKVSQDKNKTKNEEIDWKDVNKNDVGVMYNQGGAAGHIFTVKDPTTGTIISKDGNERVREGKLTVGDDLHSAYGGDIKIFRVDPGVKPNIKVSNIKSSKK